MSAPRHARREVVTRRPHPCAWCPDEIPAGTLAATWSWLGWPILGHGYAHPICEDITCAEIGEAFGDDDHLAGMPDREGMLRTLSFMDGPDDIRAMCRDYPEEFDRLTAMWAHPKVQGWRAAGLAREARITEALRLAAIARDSGPPAGGDCGGTE